VDEKGEGFFKSSQFLLCQMTLWILQKTKKIFHEPLTHNENVCKPHRKWRPTPERGPFHSGKGARGITPSLPLFGFSIRKTEYNERFVWKSKIKILFVHQKDFVIPGNLVV
jgi:hypothetical protein